MLQLVIIFYLMYSLTYLSVLFFPVITHLLFYCSSLYSVLDLGPLHNISQSFNEEHKCHYWKCSKTWSYKGFANQLAWSEAKSSTNKHTSTDPNWGVFQQRALEFHLQ